MSVSTFGLLIGGSALKWKSLPCVLVNWSEIWDGATKYSESAPYVQELAMLLYLILNI